MWYSVYSILFLYGPFQMVSFQQGRNQPYTKSSTSDSLHIINLGFIHSQWNVGQRQHPESTAPSRRSPHRGRLFTLIFVTANNLPREYQPSSKSTSPGIFLISRTRCSVHWGRCVDGLYTRLSRRFHLASFSQACVKVHCHTNSDRRETWLLLS